MSEIKTLLKVKKDDERDIHQLLEKLEKKNPDVYFSSSSFSMVLDATEKGSWICYSEDKKGIKTKIPKIKCQI